MVGSLTAGCPQLLRTLINGCTSVDGNEVSLVNNASLNKVKDNKENTYHGCYNTGIAVLNRKT